MLLHDYNFHEWDIREVPAYWLAEMIESTGDPIYQTELDRRLAELHRQDELELETKQGRAEELFRESTEKTCQR